MNRASHVARLVIAVLAPVALAACATGGGGEAETRAEVRTAEVRTFDTWDQLFLHYTPRATVRGECVVRLGRGESDPPPVIEIDGQRSFDGCPPPGFEPEDIVEVRVLGVAGGGTPLGTLGAGGQIRMRTRAGGG